MKTFFEQELSTKKKLFLSFLFSLIYAQSPLYYSNQNTYFLQGLADAEVGTLSHDWMANTADPFPLFSFLVSSIQSYLPSFSFHILYMCLLGLFMYSALGIVESVWGLRKTKHQLPFFLALSFFFSLFLSFTSKKLFGFNLSYFFQNGLADQYILGKVLQPSVFGIFLFFSIYLFLRRRFVFAIIALGVAVNFHATYLLSAAFLTMVYMGLLGRRGEWRSALLVGGLSFVVVLPNLIYTYLTFGSQPAESLLAAQKILVDFRIPHHAKIEAWFGLKSLLKIGLISSAIFVARKKKNIVWILALPFSLSIFLSVIQYFSASHFLALLFPWRVSVLLVPLSVVILAGACFDYLRSRSTFENPTKIFASIFSVLLLVLIGTGVSSFFLQYKNDRDRPAFKAEEAARQQKAEKMSFLIPPELERFRIRVGAPVFVDKKTHPYQAGEVLEWYERFGVAQSFYERPVNCEELAKVMDSNALTHVVDRRSLDCSFLSEVYGDESYRLFEKR